MDRDLSQKLVEEIEKVRKDLDKIQSYQKTMAEAIQTIAINTTPADNAVET